jgi:hypothetical protein
LSEVKCTKSNQAKEFLQQKIFSSRKLLTLVWILLGFQFQREKFFQKTMRVLSLLRHGCLARLVLFHSIKPKPGVDFAAVRPLSATPIALKQPKRGGTKDKGVSPQI